MAKLTPAAAAQIRESALQSNATDLPLRIAVTRNSGGTLQYAVGFDDVGGTNDMRFDSEGIVIVVAPDSIELTRELVVDYVQLDSGEMAFVFLNPQDPDYIPSK